jgi:Flp pilus assembly pilin Flp
MNKETDGMAYINQLLQLARENRAVAVLEYGLLSSLLAAAAVGGLSTLGRHLIATVN